MRYLFDTCTISDFIKGEKNTLRRVKSTPPADIAISTITLMEIRYGLILNPMLAKKISSIIEDFLKPVCILNFNDQHAAHAASIRAHLKTLGTPIGWYDILLAGVALHEKIILVTSNAKEFNRIKTLKIENWRE